MNVQTCHKISYLYLCIFLNILVNSDCVFCLLFVMQAMGQGPLHGTRYHGGDKHLAGRQGLGCCSTSHCLLSCSRGKYVSHSQLQRHSLHSVHNCLLQLCCSHNFDIRGSMHHSAIHKKIQQDATVYQIFIRPYLYEAQHVSGDTPPIIRSLKLH